MDRKLKVFSALVLATTLFNCPQINAMPDGKILTKNITNSTNILEVNPRFVGDGSNIVFLEYQNSNEDILPWDYKLVMCDRSGHTFNYLTETGVIDYEIMPGGLEIQYLVSTEKITNEVFDEYTFYDQIDDWELWQVDLKTKSIQLVEKSNGRLLSAGYRLLDGHGLPNYYEGNYTTHSPNENRAVFIEIEEPFVKFYEIQRGDKKLVHTSGLYKTYGDIPWMPQVIWQSEDSFITLNYHEGDKGNFSIININLAMNETIIIYEDEEVCAFSRMNLDDFTTMLYFSKQNDAGGSELWRISLKDGQGAKMLYRHNSQIGTAFSSMDGTSVVFSQLAQNDFDIVRLDFGSNKIQRLTAN